MDVIECSNVSHDATIENENLDANCDFDIRGTLYLNPTFSDVTLTVEFEEEIYNFPTHSLVLSVASEVFRAMLEAPMVESQSRKIIIRSVTPEAVENTLRYIYQGKIKLENWKDAVEVLRVAHMYEIFPLVRTCVKFLISKLDLYNACHLLQTAILYDFPELLDKSLLLCGKAAFVITKTKGFFMLSAEAVRSIMELSYLNVESELALFDSLWRWSTLSCCRKNKTPTEYNVFEVFLKFADYIKFDKKSKGDLSRLTHLVSKRFLTKQDLPLQESTSIVFRTLRDCLRHVPNSRLSFHRDLLKFAANFELKFSNPLTAQSVHLQEQKDLICMCFTMDQSVCLWEFVLVGIFNEVPELLRVTWIGGEKKYIYFLSNNNMIWKTVGQLCGQMKIMEAKVSSRSPFMIESGQKCNLTVRCSHGKNNLQWPRCIKNQSLCSNNVKMTIHSESCYGISRLAFIAMP